MGFIETGGWPVVPVPIPGVAGPQPRARIPFFIGQAPPQPNGFTAAQQNVIQTGINSWNNAPNQSFVRLVPATPADQDYVRFLPAVQFCRSHVGRQGGEQIIGCDLNAGSGFNAVSIAHEIGHAVGLLHEHQRPDRNFHINVANIQPDWENDLRVLDGEWGFNTGPVGNYDCASIMHYRSDPLVALITAAPPPPPPPAGVPPPPPCTGCPPIGGNILSNGDIQAIQVLYQPLMPGGGFNRIPRFFKAKGWHFSNWGRARRKALKRMRRYRRNFDPTNPQPPGTPPPGNLPRGVYENPLLRSREELGIPLVTGVEYKLTRMYVAWHF